MSASKLLIVFLAVLIMANGAIVKRQSNPRANGGRDAISDKIPRGKILECHSLLLFQFLLRIKTA